MSTSRRTFLKTIAAGSLGSLVAFESRSRSLAAPTSFDIPKISVFSRHFHWTDWAGTAERAKLIGFDGVDLTVRPNGHVLPERAAQDLPKAVKAIRDRGVEVYTIATAINDASDAYAEDIIRTAASLGIRCYRMNWFRFHPDRPLPEQLEAFKSRFARLYELNKKYGIHGCYQNHAGDYFGASVWDLFHVLKEFDPEYIGCQFDIRHATVEGYNSWKNDFRIIAPFIKSQNVKDFSWTKTDQRWQANSVPLGEGLVDFESFIPLMKQHNLSGPISLHFEYPLGGADQGASKLTIDENVLIDAMRRDLEQLRTWLS